MRWDATPAAAGFTSGHAVGGAQRRPRCVPMSPRSRRIRSLSLLSTYRDSHPAPGQPTPRWRTVTGSPWTATIARRECLPAPGGRPVGARRLESRPPPPRRVLRPSLTLDAGALCGTTSARLLAGNGAGPFAGHHDDRRLRGLRAGRSTRCPRMPRSSSCWPTEMAGPRCANRVATTDDLCGEPRQRAPRPALIELAAALLIVGPPGILGLISLFAPDPKATRGP